MKTDQPAIKAIQTNYKGYRFRSRLEARWAVFFDALNLRWEYEKEGFTLPSGPYLPDFYIPPQPRTAGMFYWLEIKPTKLEDYKLFELGHLLEEGQMSDIPGLQMPCSNHFAVLIGNIPDPADMESRHNHYFYGYEEGDFFAQVEGDQPYLWCVCPCGQAVGLQFDGRGARIPCPCNGKGSDKDYSFSHPDLLMAFGAARSARFEHGESGGVRG